MKRTKLKKEHLTIAVIVVAVISLSFYWWFVQQENESYEKCLEDKSDNFSTCSGTIAIGEISVLFQKELTTNEIISLIEIYELNYTRLFNGTFLSIPVVHTIVTVPRGEEFEWMCRFETNDIVVGTWRGCSNLHSGGPPL